MTVMKNGQNYFSLFWHSDEHTLHPHTPTSHILDNISRLRNRIGIDSIDMEVWGGDLCHDTTYTSDVNYEYLQRWVRDYLYDCHDRKIVVRILAGTASHDWEQPEMFELLKPKHSTYIKYVKTLSIEYIKEFDIHILYVPDNFGNKPKTEIYNEAVELIASYGLKKVDFIFLHGGFDFQMPLIANKNDSLYNSKAWSQLAGKIILSGHIHKPSNKYNIYSSGSVDRLSYGEMHPKGAYHVLWNKNDVIPMFIENERAMIYDDIELMPTDKAKDIYLKAEFYFANPSFIKGSGLRFVGGDYNEVNTVVNDLKLHYPFYRFEIKNSHVEGQSQEVDIVYPECFEVNINNEDSFKEQLFRFIGDKHPKGITNESLEKELDEVFKEEDV